MAASVGSAEADGTTAPVDSAPPGSSEAVGCPAPSPPAPSSEVSQAGRVAAPSATLAPAGGAQVKGSDADTVWPSAETAWYVIV